MEILSSVSNSELVVPDRITVRMTHQCHAIIRTHWLLNEKFLLNCILFYKLFTL